MLVELKNGETLNGHLVNCDTWMNLTLKEVVQTSPVRYIRCVTRLLHGAELTKRWGALTGRRQVCTVTRDLRKRKQRTLKRIQPRPCWIWSQAQRKKILTRKGGC